MPSTGPAADAARAAFREHVDAKGHAVDNARVALTALQNAIDMGVLVRTPELDQMLYDLAAVLDAAEGEKLGGKSAEAARFIMRAISRELDRA